MCPKEGVEVAEVEVVDAKIEIENCRLLGLSLEMPVEEPNIWV